MRRQNVHVSVPQNNDLMSFKEILQSFNTVYMETDPDDTEEISAIFRVIPIVIDVSSGQQQQPSAISDPPNMSRK